MSEPEARGPAEIESSTALYEHARPVIDPERQAALDRRFVRAREVALYRDIDRDLEGIPIEPAGPPDLKVFEDRAAELTPEDATDEMRTRIAQVAAHAHRHAERQWSRRQAEAGVAAFYWVAKNPGRSFLAIPPEVRDWLAPDQWHGLEAFYIDGRLRTDRDLYERLDWQLIYEPHAFAGADLDRHRLSLDDEDHARFVAGQKAIVEGRVDPGHVRHDWLRRGIDRALTVLGIDTNGPEAADARADARDQLDSFETIEGRAPVGADLDDIARRVVETLAPEVTGTRETATPSPDPGSNAGTIEDIGPVPDEDDSVEEQPEPPDSPFDEEATLSPFPADGEEHDEHVASAAPDNADDVSIVPDVEPPGMATPDLGSVEDGTPPRFADDPNIIRVAGGANSPRRGGGGRPTTPTEQIRAANFQSTLNAIRELEPNNRELSGITTRDWIPSDRDIARVREELLRAKARAAGETSAVPVGKYAGESIPAGSPGRRLTSEERREVDRIGSERGCHSCGATSPGTSLQHWVPDHQPPTALTRQGQAQRLYPQCLSCSRQQGGEVNNLKREGNRE